MKNNTKKKMIELSKNIAVGYMVKQFYDKNNREYVYDTLITKIGKTFHTTSDSILIFNSTIKWIKSLDNKRMNLYINSYDTDKYNYNDTCYTMNEGYYKFIYNNCIILISVKNYRNLNNSDYYKININFIGKNNIKIKNELIRFINNEIKINKDKQTSIASSDGRYIEYHKHSSNGASCIKYIAVRDLNSIFSDQIDKIISILEKWKDLRKIYSEHHLPFKTGLLLYGKPGTGKTSMIKAIATYFSMKIYSVNLSTISSKSLEIFCNNLECDNSIIVLEEIDLGINLEKENLTNTDIEKEKKIQILLNLLDGLDSKDSTVFIATTNYIDRLDARIKRSGRFDNLVEVTDISKEKAIKMCKSFNIEDKDIDKILDNDIFNNSKLYNPADLQNQILKFISEI